MHSWLFATTCHEHVSLNFFRLILTSYFLVTWLSVVVIPITYPKSPKAFKISVFATVTSTIRLSYLQLSSPAIKSLSPVPVFQITFHKKALSNLISNECNRTLKTDETDNMMSYTGKS